MTQHAHQLPRGLSAIIATFMLAGFAASLMPSTAAAAEAGIASVYSPHGSTTASGESTPIDALTAAHRTLPFGTRVEITNTRNGKTVVVRINDRGPFVPGRVIDVAPEAALILGFSELAPVSIVEID
jgi:rare lipoprotein A